jgi:hypothetical protein
MYLWPSYYTLETSHIMKIRTNASLYLAGYYIFITSRLILYTDRKGMSNSVIYMLLFGFHRIYYGKFSVVLFWTQITTCILRNLRYPFYQCIERDVMKVSGMLWKYNIPLNIISRKKKSRKCSESVKQPKIERELEYTRGFLRYSM